MKIIILLSLIVAVVLIIILFHKNRKTVSHKDKARLHKPPGKSNKNKSGKIVRKQTPGNDSPLNRIPSESHPNLKEINYFIPAEDTFPATLQDLEEKTRKIIDEKISVLPPMPAISIKLLGLLRNPESNPNSITALVSTNPVFSGKILQTINSSYFALPGKITSVGRAITLLGYNNVRTLVFQETIKNTIPKHLDMETDLYMKTWVHSAIVSTCAGHIGKKLFKFSEYDLATIGLLHDIGKYFLVTLESHFEIISDIPALIKEEHRYGINHAVAGGLIANQWKLPDVIIHGIEYHHYPSLFLPEAIPKQYRTQCFTICLADLIAKVLGYHGQDEQILPIRDEYFEMYGINKDIRGIVTTDLIKDVEKSRLAVESYIDAA
ncbi:MAG: HDOD domain-containing protein [Deltaproteobacteria bacterium]|nr:HDOD domain-containing protein [Deltaproteobacteria bacterium]